MDFFPILCSTVFTKKNNPTKKNLLDCYFWRANLPIISNPSSRLKPKSNAEPQRWSHEICRTRTTWTLRKAAAGRRQGHHGNPRSTPLTKGFFGVRIWASSIFEGQHCWCLNRSQPVESGSLAYKIHNVSIQFHTCISDIITMKRCHLTYHKLYINRGSRSIPKACQLDKLGWQSRSPNPTDPSNPWKTSPTFFLC